MSPWIAGLLGLVVGILLGIVAMVTVTRQVTGEHASWWRWLAERVEFGGPVTLTTHGGHGYALHFATDDGVARQVVGPTLPTCVAGGREMMQAGLLDFPYKSQTPGGPHVT